MRYLWTDGVSPEPGQKLSGDVHTEVCIIGGGMAGILCAARLTECGIDNVVVEASYVGGGITKGTTAVLTAQHDVLYQNIVRMYDKERAWQYLHANLDALQRFRQMSKDIDCEFETYPSVMYSMTGKDNLKKEAELLKELGFDAVYTTDPKLPFSVKDAVVYPNMAQFHPLRFLYAVAKRLKIYTNSFVKKLEGTTAYTEQGKIIAEKIIVATHFPFINRHGLYFMKEYQKRSYVIAYENAPLFSCTAEDAGEGFYFRNYRNLLLIGGGDHRTGKKGGGYAAVEEFARRHFPSAREVYRWSNQDCVTLDGIPYIGQYSHAMPHVYVATGFNLWGMTTSMAAADILCDMISGKENPYASVFATNRSIWHPQLFCNFGETLADFAFPTVKRCPHLGCALRYNAAEHSWDCPCHGSRFDENGELIENPAMRNADV
ncbi:MAG: FAD-dependent oxidoreductase [Eubacteriales bacterium]|nr:FAD-dependent oxidoreductase [Eubacteriales bacterium]